MTCLTSQQRQQQGHRRDNHRGLYTTAEDLASVKQSRRHRPKPAGHPNNRRADEDEGEPGRSDARGIGDQA